MTDTLERLTSALADRYTIEHEIGAGGMATVYLAHDVKHDRKVALKVLRPELAAVIGAERFLAEIKTTANLQHPHILALHDSGEVGGTVFYVMPFVEGESLRDQLNREKQLPVADAVRVATEVAGALDYAHRKGIIHRDIKPENILLHDGQALVADFGIALAAATTGGTRMTETGMSLGTPHYMSPEQAMGERELDARTDVYALGCVLYEMLTGDPPFTGSSAQAIVAKVMTEKPASIRGFRDTVPVEVEATVLTALNKLPADRFASAPEFATALTTPGHATTLAAAPASAAPATWLRDRRTIALATVAGLALVTAVATMGGGAEDSVPRPALFGIPLPEGLDPRAAALAPDGSSMVLLAADSTNQRRLYYRALDTPDVRPIAGTEGATAPFYAPDSRRVAFGARGALRVVTLPEGTPTVVPGTDRGMIDQGGGLAGGAWNAAGTIVFSPAFGQIGLWRVPESGGTPEHFSRTRCRPAFLPNDETLLCGGEQGLSLMSLSTGEETLLGMEGREPRYANGRIVFLRAGRPFVVEFDPHRQETVTEPVPVLGLLAGRFLDAMAFAERQTIALSSTGLLGFIQAPPALSHLVAVDETGRSRRLLPDAAVMESPRISPDGNRVAVAVSRSEGGRNVWILDVERGTFTRITDEQDGTYPIWSPGGDRIAYSGGERGFDILMRAADGTGSTTTMVAGDMFQFPAGFTRDEQWLVYRENHPETREDIRVIELATGTIRTLVGTDATELQPALSPDGRWVAFASEQSGRREIYVRPFEEPDRRWVISNAGGDEPRWSRDGGTLYYRDGASLLAVDVAAGDDLAPGVSRVVFADRFDRNARIADYDPMPSGEFVMLEPAERTEATAWVIVNWTALARAR